MLPWWLSGKEPTCQCRRHDLIPGREDTLEKETATHSSILAWEIPWTDEPGRATVHGVTKKIRYNLVTKQYQCQNYHKWLEERVSFFKKKSTVSRYIVVVQLLSHVQLFETPWTVAYQVSLSFTVSWSLFRHTFIQSVMKYIVHAPFWVYVWWLLLAVNLITTTIFKMIPLFKKVFFCSFSVNYSLILTSALHPDPKQLICFLLLKRD